MASPIDNLFGAQEQAMLLHERRVNLISSNIANSDTPHFKARDINFREAMKASISPLKGSLKTTHTKHMGSMLSPKQAGQPLYRVPNHSSLDGNTVEMHAEQAAFSESSLRYQASVRFMRGTVNKLKSAMRSN